MVSDHYCCSYNTRPSVSCYNWRCSTYRYNIILYCLNLITRFSFLPAFETVKKELDAKNTTQEDYICGLSEFDRDVTGLLYTADLRANLIRRGKEISIIIALASARAQSSLPNQIISIFSQKNVFLARTFRQPSCRFTNISLGGVALTSWTHVQSFKQIRATVVQLRSYDCIKTNFKKRERSKLYYLNHDFITYTVCGNKNDPPKPP